MKVGKVKGAEIRKNKDGSSNVLLLQVEISDPKDIQTVELLTQAGEDTNPPDGSLVAILPVGEAWKVAIACKDGIVPTMGRGEKKIYSSAGGVIKAFIELLSTGINKIWGETKVQIDAPAIEINGSTDFAVAYNDMKAAFDQFKTEVNLVITHYNIHSHNATVPPNSTPQSLVTADMAGAKVDTVKLP
jgi:phage gp45-like